MPPHEQALEYLDVPEQAEAYVGTELGSCVTCRAATVLEGARSKSFRFLGFRAAIVFGGVRRKSFMFLVSRATMVFLSTRGTGVLFELDPITEYEVNLVTVTVVYDVAGVMDRTMKLEQSAVREARAAAS